MNLFSDLFRGRDWIKNLPQGKHKLSRYHWYNMVSPSPWPILLGTNALPITIGLVGCMQGINNSFEMLIAGFISFFFIFTMWNRDIVRESTFMGVHTKQVDANTILGFKLFLFSEIMLFVSFFWAHLFSALYPSVFIGLSWPPVGLTDLLLDPFDIPLTNTVILVYSGFTVTLSHLYLRRGSIFLSAIAMAVTILFGLAFLYIQYSEYAHAEYDISDGIYGCTFYMLTGFHGGHVIIGVSALIITLIRLIELHFSSYSHTGYKLALIYWHFVDVVWIFVFLIVYVLGYDLTYPNIIYYTNSDYLGCIVNLDQAFFGKWWRGVKILQDNDYLYNINSFERVCWSQIFYDVGVSSIQKNLTFCNLYSDSSTFKIWFTTKKFSEFTLTDKTKFFYDNIVNDQNELSKDHSQKLEESFNDLSKAYYSKYLYHHFFNLYLIEKSSQWLYGWENYQKNKAHDALNLFYIFKLLPSFSNDSINKTEGLENFYGKIIIFNESHNNINNLSLKNNMDNLSYVFGFNIWEKFWPNNVTQGVIPKWLRVMYIDSFKSHDYPVSLSRDICK
jgi:heme/copper-type cytochrome/quinol oxidase subunit 3